MTQRKHWIPRAIALFLLFLLLPLPLLFLSGDRDGTAAELRGELLALLEQKPDAYDTQTLALVDCPYEKGEEIARRLGAVLVMSPDLCYGRLELPETTDAHTAIATADDAYLAYLSPNAYLYAEDLGVDDPYAGAVEGLGTSLMNLGDTWSLTAGSAGGYRVKIAVIDSGIDYTHEELAGRISEESYAVGLGKSVREMDGDFSILAATGTPHGTKVSSVIMAAADNGVGIAGLAYDCEFVFVKLTDTGGSFRADEMMAGISYAASIGCDVINLSLGGYDYLAAYDTVINQAVASGSVVVCAAGNDAKNTPHYPSSCTNAISVGALGSYNYYYRSTSTYESYTAIAEYSNYGAGLVDVVAPGTWLTATDSLYCTAYPTASNATGDIQAKDSYYGGSWYNTASGTSLASPAVAAVIGLYRSLHPDATVAQIKSALCASCRDLGDRGYDEYYGYGLVDISAFVGGTTATITYNWGDSASTVSRASVAVGHAANSTPALIGNGSQVFAGWYLDETLTQSVDPYTHLFGGDTVLYAAWAEETEGSAFDFRLADPTMRAIDLMAESGDGNAYALLAKTASRIVRAYPDPRDWSAHRSEIYDIIRASESAKMADLTTDALCARTAAYTVYGYYGIGTEITVPASADGLPVVGIANHAFSGSGILHIDLPGCLVSIGDFAFRNCKSLTWMQIPVSVTVIGDGAFSGSPTKVATLLEAAPDGWRYTKYRYRYQRSTSGTWYTNYTHIWYDGTGEVAFSTERLIENGIEALVEGDGYLLVAYRGSAEELTVGQIRGKDLLRVLDGAFAENQTLRRITLPASLTDVGESAFFGCTALAEVVFEAPENLLSLGASAFAGCSALRTFAVPENLTALPESCFAGCESLYEVRFLPGNALVSIGNSAFADCISLSRLSLLNCTNLTSVGSAFRRCTALTYLAIPSGVNAISAGALRDCNALEWLSLPFAGGSASTSSNAFLGYLFGATDPGESEQVVPDSIRTLVLSQRVGEREGMLSGLSGATVYLTNTRTSTLAQKLPEDNTYFFRGEWKSIPCYFGADLYANLPYTAETCQSLSMALPMPGGTSFAGWDADEDGIADTLAGTETRVELLTSAKTYIVTYLDHTGEPLLTLTGLAFGDPVSPPSVALTYETPRSRFAFTAWSNTAKCAVADLTVTPLYTETLIPYTVTVKDKNSDRQAIRTLYWGDPVEPLPSYTEAGYRYDFVFDGETQTPAVSGSGTYLGSFNATKIFYTVRFYNDDGSLLSERQYEYLEQVVFPATPEKAPGTRYVYIFDGWDKTVEENVSANAAYQAVYRSEPRVYTVTFLDTAGNVIATRQCGYEETVAAPAVPERESDAQYTYAFLGWDREFVSTVREDATYTACYQATLRSYRILFRDYDGTVLLSTECLFGETPTAPEPPHRAGNERICYVFSGWDQPLAATQGETVYTARYEETPRMYTVRFFAGDGTLLSEGEYAWGETPVPPAGYTGEVLPVSGAATYTEQSASGGGNTVLIALLSAAGGVAAVGTAVFVISRKKRRA